MAIGRIINSICDKFLPDVVGDVLGAALDGITGDFAGCAANALDAVEDVLEYAGCERAAEIVGMLDDVVGLASAGGAAGVAGGAASVVGGATTVAARAANGVATTAQVVGTAADAAGQAAAVATSGQADSVGDLFERAGARGGAQVDGTLHGLSAAGRLASIVA